MITHVFVQNLVTANDLISANRTNKYMAAKLKKDETKRVIDLAEEGKPYTEYPLFLFVICEFTRKSCDFDNGWTSVKPILDGLQKTDPKIILKDSLTYIGTPAIIEYVSTKRRATHLILSPNEFLGKRYQLEVKQKLQESVDLKSDLPYTEDHFIQFEEN